MNLSAETEIAKEARCPHGNRMGGNWCGCPPNVEWEAKLLCCGVAFSGKTYKEAHAKFAAFASKQKANKKKK